MFKVDYSGDNILTQIEEHDQEAMLQQTSGGGTSYRYLGDSERSLIRKELERIRPFSLCRKKIDHFDKSSGSVFSGLSVERLQSSLIGIDRISKEATLIRIRQGSINNQ